MNYVLTQQQHLNERITHDQYNHELISKLTTRIFQIAEEKGLSMTDISDNFPGGIDVQSIYRFKRLGLKAAINPSVLFLHGLAVSMDTTVYSFFE